MTKRLRGFIIGESGDAPTLLLTLVFDVNQGPATQVLLFIFLLNPLEITIILNL
jgi:hypothetical protein